MASAVAALREHLVARLTEPSRAWLESTLAAPFDPRGFAQSFALAGRKLKPSAEAPAPATAEEIAWAVEGAPIDEIGRMLLLVEAASRPHDGGVDLVSETYRQGDVKEKRAVLRALPLLSGAERHVELAVNACRSSVQTVFEAIACENPYPERHFNDASFNQMVLKALFTGAPLERIRGVRGRTTAELSRMAHGYASERRAAGRSVPEDIDRFFGGSV
jgi:hypothetical protein